MGIETVKILGVEDWFIYLLITLIGVALCFAGKSIVKALVSFASGLLLGVFLYVLIAGGTDSAALGFVAALIGFLIGLAIGYFLFRVAISVIVGVLIGNYIATYLKMYYPEVFTKLGAEYSSIVLALIFIVIIYLIFNVILSIVTVILGAALVYTGLSAFIASSEVVLLITGLIAIAGLVVQLSRRKKRRRSEEK
ncbi:MAG: hypothetical protein DRO18_00160 [Thermoprotei archaeon]|nr:MAG: hypothetical protein DRO18_00160 [Thermoprotei archaeon]